MRTIVAAATAAAVAGALTFVAPAAAHHSTDTGINCANFGFQEDAQLFFEEHPGDPEGLDGPPGSTSAGIPNVACEELPSRGSLVTTTVPPVQPAPTTTTTVLIVYLDSPTTTTTVQPIQPIRTGVLDRTG